MVWIGMYKPRWAMAFKVVVFHENQVARHRVRYVLLDCCHIYT